MLPLLAIPPRMAVTPAMPRLLPLLLPLLAAAPLAVASSTTIMWHSAWVTQSQLTAASQSQILKVKVPDMVCAIKATQTPWCHLFTHNESDCVLYDLLVDSLADPPPEDQDATACKTRLRNVCITEDQLLLHEGDGVEKECFSYTCMDRVLVPTAGVSTCDDPFASHDVGCVHLLSKDKNWCDARKYCASLGADLAVVEAEKYQSLQQFLADNADDKEVWVGVKGRKWLEGRDVDASEWHDGEPNGDITDCARMRIGYGTYALADKGCDDKYRVLCMRK